MADNVVDEARVVVRPDTTKFARELKQKLAQINEELDVTAVVDLDTTQAKAALERFSKEEARIDADVVPQTAKASDALKAWGVEESGTLDVKPGVDPKTESASAKLATWAQKESGDLTVKGSIDLKTANASLLLKAWRAREGEKAITQKVVLDRGTIGGTLPSIDEQVNVDTRKATAELEAWRLRESRKKVTQNIDVDRGIGGTVSKLAGLFEFLEKTGVGVLGTVAELGEGFMKLGSTAVNGVGMAGEQFGNLAGQASKAGGMIGTVVGTVFDLIGKVISFSFVVGGIASVVMLIGAAVTALWGSIVALTAVVPGLAAGFGAVFAVIKLGAQGIKDAFATIKPQFDDLKKTINSTMRDNLTPVFQMLKPLFPLLKQGAMDVAYGIGQMGAEVAKMLTSTQGMYDLSEIFRRVRDFLIGIAPNISNFVGEMLHLAASAQIWGVLRDMIAGVLDKLTGLFVRLQSTGVMQKALEGLNSVLQAAVQFIADFSFYAAQFFASAAPGLTKFWQGLSAFLSKFDWKLLGSLFGDLFGKLGEGLAKIPKGTIENLEAAIVKVSDAVMHFIDSGGLTMLINLLSILVGMFADVVNIINSVLDAFNWIKGGVGDLVQGFENSLGGIFGFGNALDTSGTKGKRAMGSAFQGIGKSLDGIAGSMSKKGKQGGNGFAGGVAEGGAKANKNARDSAKQLPGNLHTDLSPNGRSIMSSFWDGLKSMWNSVTGWIGDIGGWISAHKGPVSYDARLLIPHGKAIMGGFLQGLLKGFTAIRSFIAGVAGYITGGFEPLSSGGLGLEHSIAREVTGDVNATVSGNDLYSLPERIARELGGLQWKIDGSFATIVNRQNAQGARR